MKVAKDIMSSGVVTIDVTATFEEVLTLMKTRKIGNIPVMDNEILIGIITRDSMLEHNETAPNPPAIFFWDIMVSFAGTQNFKKKLDHVFSYKLEDFYSEHYLLVDENASVEKIVTEMLENKYSCALVGSEDLLIGIITKSDLIEKSF
ncbi:MAG: CBS domain-containing protein [Fusobacteria bacterium]|nr:CBS domain-containing protein [Fusobacteriota bacterium]